MKNFIRVFDHKVDRDPSTIQIPYSFGSDEDELNVIDTQVLDLGIVEGDKRKEMLKNLAKPILCSHGEVHLPTLRLSQRFKNKEDVKQLVNLNVVPTKRSLYFEKIDQTRFRVKSKGVVPGFTQCRTWTKSKLKSKKVVQYASSTYPWLLFVSRRNSEEDWMVKSIVPYHNCVYTREIKAFTTKFIAKNIWS